MSIETLLLIVLIIVIAGAVPAWPHSRSWGYVPSGIITLLLVIFLVWAIAGERPLFRRGGEGLRSAGRDVADSIRHIGR